MMELVVPLAIERLHSFVEVGCYLEPMWLNWIIPVCSGFLEFKNLFKAFAKII